MRVKAKNKLLAWLGVFALLLATFAPIVSHAIELHDVGHEQVVCSQNGVKFIPHSSPFGHSHQLNLNHCAYCSLATDKQFIHHSDVSLNTKIFNSSTALLHAYDVPILQAYFQSAHPPQAPPNL